MSKRFEQKNILIIGASTGIGHAIATHLLAEGAIVFVAGRSKPDLDVTFVPWDATQPDSAAFDSLPAVLDGLVYCPGTINLKPFNRLSVKDFSDDFQINTLGAVFVLQAVINRLKKAQGAGVVFFSSVAASTGLSFHASVSVSKSALEGLSVALSAEYADSGIRFNVVAPSLTDTPLAGKLLASDDKREASAKRHPLGRIGDPQDIASAAVFLLSNEASWITGQVLGVDGGLGKLK
ncbi:SDR family NAD(P)-dependent oxidoreductase [Arundinibacter roseus]|uniref:SDR family oxidoreductase n=1 Tax=Arundinibacter roseus TaxID=2070510 RepID=A0A4R4KK79_9BACT|nr:SDR family oxidoreductase [Arundinibacter roseus]TDB66991.1 SDR family oxidoreductase [Arundinibacter roseus]